MPSKQGIQCGIENPSFELHENGNHHQDQITNGLVEIKLNDKLQQKASVEPSKERNRSQWGHGLEFLMSCIAMSVGLGNIWRFPFTCYENGGGAFLIPYLIVLTLIGRPMYYMEMIMGQFSQIGGCKIYSYLAPGLTGVGFSQLIGSISIASYYCSLMAITLFYLVNSFTGTLPWTYCRDSWNPYLNSLNISCSAASNLNETELNRTKVISSSELYFSQEVLQEKSDISDGIGYPEWRLSLCLIVTWVVTFLVSRRGVASSGKASYFLAIFPYVIMIILLIRAATLEGASEGMYYFIKTDWSKLLEPDVWYAAVSQCFFSLNIAFGSIINYSSFNEFGHNINRDALVVTTLDTFTSLLSGVTIFGILGNLAFELGVTPDKVINSGGTGLAFISYPDAIAKFDGVPWLFAILFFTMLFVLGIGSLVSLQTSINTAIADAFPNLKKWKISLGTAVAGTLVGLIYLTPGGQFMLTLVDHFGGTVVIFLFAILEVTAVVWFYGLENFCLDIEFMLKKKVGIYWRITWGIFTPLTLIFIFIYFIAKLERLKYGPFDYPDGVLAFGWTIVGISVIQSVLWICYYYYKNREYGCKTAIKKITSHEKFLPGDKNLIDSWRNFKEERLLQNAIRNDNWFKRKLGVLIGK